MHCNLFHNTGSLSTSTGETVNHSSLLGGLFVPLRKGKTYHTEWLTTRLFVSYPRAIRRGYAHSLVFSTAQQVHQSPLGKLMRSYQYLIRGRNGSLAGPFNRAVGLSVSTAATAIQMRSALSEDLCYEGQHATIRRGGRLPQYSGVALRIDR